MSGHDGSANLVWLILGCAVLTYATRIGGHLILARLPSVPPRLDAVLNAVPVAVLGALIAPAVLASGPAETLAAAAGAVVGLRLSATWVIAIGLGVLIAARQLGV